MKKILLVLAVIFSLTACGAHNKKRTALTQELQHASESVFFLQSSRLQKSTLYIKTGMAVAVENSEDGCLLMTNAHLVDNADAITVLPWSGIEPPIIEKQHKSLPAKLVFTHDFGDFAVLHISSKMECNPAKIAGHNPSPGEVIVAYGQPVPKKGVMTRGIVSGYWNIDDRGRLMVADILTTAGFSGTGIFLANHRLAGLVSGKTADTRPGFAYIIAAERLQQLINMASSELQLKKQQQKSPTKTCTPSTKKELNNEKKHINTDTDHHIFLDSNSTGRKAGRI